MSKGKSTTKRNFRRKDVCMGPQAVDKFLELLEKAEDKGLLSLKEVEYLREALDEPIK